MTGSNKAVLNVLRWVEKEREVVLQPVSYYPWHDSGNPAKEVKLQLVTAEARKAAQIAMESDKQIVFDLSGLSLKFSDWAAVIVAVWRSMDKEDGEALKIRGISKQGRFTFETLGFARLNIEVEDEDGGSCSRQAC